MDILKPRDETRWEIAIHFKTERAAIIGLMPRREYNRMLKEFRRGNETGTYEFIIEGTVTETTFPLQEIDTIHAVSEIKDDE